MPRAWISAAVGLVAVLAVARIVLLVLDAPFQGWTDARLAIPAAMLHGYGLYSLPGHGPLLGNPYGPAFALVFAPAALMPTPALAVTVGTLLCVLAYFLPAAWLVSIETAERPSRVAALAFFCLFTYRSDVLREASSGVHPDPLALGTSTIACALLYAPERRRETSRLLASAAATIVAVGAKQVVAPVPIGIAAYLWIMEGAAIGRRYLLAVVGFASLALMLGALTLDLGAMVHNTLTVPLSQPWRRSGGVGVLLGALRDLAPRALPFLTVLAAATGIGAVGNRGSLSGWAARNGWTMLGIAAVLCIPTSLLGRVKYGGSLNTLSYTMYFAVLGAILAVLRVERERGLARRRVASVSLAIAALWAALDQLPIFLDSPSRLNDLPRNPETTGYAFARAHPQQAYFPHQALISLMAEGKAYHSAVGLEDSAVAGFPITESEFRAYLPKDLRFVLVRRKVDFERYALGFLPTFTKRIELRELPGWTVLVEDDSALR